MKHLALSILLCFLSYCSLAQYSTPDFDLDAFITDGPVTAHAQKGDTVYLGGNFTYIGPRTGGVVLLHPTTGSMLKNAPAVSGEIIAVVSDGFGGYYIGGKISRVGNLTVNNLIHINADFSLDLSFLPVVPNKVRALSKVGDKLLVGTESLNYSSDGCLLQFSTVTKRLIRVPDLDVSQEVLALAAVGDTVFIGGGFSSVGRARRRFAAAFRSSSNTLLPWNPDLQSTINILKVSKGMVFLAGPFTAVAGTPRRYLASVSMHTGALSPFSPNIFYEIEDFEVVDTLVYFKQRSMSRLQYANLRTSAIHSTSATLNQDSILRPGQVNKLNYSSGKLFVLGSFQFCGTRQQGNMVVFDPSGDSILPYNPLTSGAVNNGLVTDSGVLLIGNFKSVGGVERRMLAAVNLLTNWVLDWDAKSTNFAASTFYGSQIRKLRIRGNKLLVLGYSIDVGNTNSITRLDLQNATAEPWTVSVNSAPSDIEVIGNSVFVAGSFWMANTSFPRNGIASFDISTQTVRSWNPNTAALVPGSVDKMTEYRGKLLVHGSFSYIGNRYRKCWALLDTLTGLPTAWQLPDSSEVRDWLLIGDTLYVAGNFNRFMGQRRNAIAAVDINTNTLLPLNPGVDSLVVNSFLLNERTLYYYGYLKSGFSSIPGSQHVSKIELASGQNSSWRVDSVETMSPIAARSGKILFSNSTPVLKGLDADHLVSLSSCTSPQAPTISVQGGRINYCSGDSVRLTATGPFPVRWSTGDTTASIIVKSSGMYTAFARSGGCSSHASATQYVNIADSISTPVVSISGRSGDTLRSSEIGSSYVWYLNTNQLVTTNVPWLHVYIWGTYTLQVVRDGCTSALSSPVTQIEHDKYLSALQLYPNPANSIFNLHLPEGTLHQVMLLDFLGRQVHTQKVEGTSTTLDIAHLPAGAYLCRITTSTGTLVRKLSIEH